MITIVSGGECWSESSQRLRTAVVGLVGVVVEQVDVLHLGEDAPQVLAVTLDVQAPAASKLFVVDEDADEALRVGEPEVR